MDANADFFSSVEDDGGAYDKWKADRESEVMRSPDGTVPYKVVSEVRSELYSPKDPTNAQTGALTKAAIEVVQCYARAASCTRRCSFRVCNPIPIMMTSMTS